MAAHDLAECDEVGRAAGRCVEHLCDLAEEVGAEDAGHDDRKLARVRIASVVEVVHGATGDAQRFPRADGGRRAFDRPGEDALEPRDRLLVAIIAVRGGDPGAGRDVELEDRDRPGPVNHLLGQLERLDYLERRPDADDLRSKRIVLTRRGKAMMRVIRDAVGEVESTWAQQLGAKRFAQLRELLLDLNTPTEPPGPTPT